MNLKNKGSFYVNTLLNLIHLNQFRILIGLKKIVFLQL
jgi:hypothetical protein